MDLDIEGALILLDDHMLVLDKPAGMLTLPDGWDPEKPHLRSLLEPHFGRLWIVHRLDKDTSGLIVLARHADAHRALNTQFERGQVLKTYRALVAGVPTWISKTVHLSLRPNGDRKHRTVIDHRHGKSAHTQLQLLQAFDAYSLVQALPKTGRTHQVRVHLAAEGHPLLGDPLYGDRSHPAHERMGRAALHAYRLTLQHPLSSEALQLEAGYPQDFLKLL